MEQSNKKTEIKIADKVPGADYANMLQVNHNQEEFHLIFANILPPTGKTVSKLVATPKHFKSMIKALNENLEKYEKKFGEIPMPEKNDYQTKSPRKIGDKPDIDNWEVA